MKPFLEWCLQHFHVGIWSTANRDNVQSLAEFVLGKNYLERVAFVWTQTQVTHTHTHTHTRHSARIQVSSILKSATNPCS